jgi:hypothetical protein
MARDPSYHERRLAEAAAAFVEARAARGRDVASRRAYATAESEFAGQLRDGRFIDDSGREFVARSGGRVRTRQLRTEERTPGRRAIERARRYGYEGDDATLRAKGQEIRRTLRSLGKDQIEIILQDARERLAASLADDDDDDLGAEATRSPATPTPTPRAASSDPTGWGADGVFRASREQIRDPYWCVSHQQDLARAGGALVLTD